MLPQTTQGGFTGATTAEPQSRGATAFQEGSAAAPQDLRRSDESPAAAGIGGAAGVGGEESPPPTEEKPLPSTEKKDSSGSADRIEGDPEDAVEGLAPPKRITYGDHPEIQTEEGPQSVPSSLPESPRGRRTVLAQNYGSSGGATQSV